MATVMQNLVDEFNSSHPDVHVTASYTGNYDLTLQKIQAAALAGNLPDAAVVVNDHTQVLAPTGALESLDGFVAKAGGKSYLNRFFQSLLLNSYSGGKLYSLPFQRSVPVLYYNKAAFAKAGIARPPSTWTEFVEDAGKLTVRSGNDVTRWGAEFPLEAYNWIYYALVYQAGGEVMSADHRKLYLDRSPAVAAMQYWWDLVNKYKVMPAYTPWPQGSQDFAGEKTAMLVYSSGAQGFFRQSAKFDWGLVRMPEGKRYGVAPGGGNLVMFKKPPAEEQAAWTFISWMMEPAQQATWSSKSGYIAVTPAAWKTPTMTKLVQEYPEVLLTVKQLDNAYYEPSAPNYTQVRDALHDATQDILANKTPLRDGLASVTTKGNAILANNP
ncbi:MAG: ABC transporter substrate-binding protein [Candidatus Eremiobacteraeota bacterium]|nr:ABC transporter substrate-binding protein [Candidatus Eremiobacteraeota bacterium]MBV8354378.1 ABC transporter substrate-binding protein [Candidatus Eremiobacteraeota bacterium]